MKEHDTASNRQPLEPRPGADQGVVLRRMQPHPRQVRPALPGKRVLQHDRRFDLEILLDHGRIVVRLCPAELAQRCEGLIVSLLHQEPARGVREEEHPNPKCHGREDL